MQSSGHLRWLTWFFFLLPVIGCSQDQPAPEPGNPAPAPLPLALVPTNSAVPVDDAVQEKYEAALREALDLLAEHRHPQALAALESARLVQDTEAVRQEIGRLKERIDQETAAERTVLDIQAVLADGKAEEAAKLAQMALLQYGPSDAAVPLARLKRQADALVSVQLSNAADRRQRFRVEGEAALREGNLRAAHLAFEQALAQGDDPDLRRQFDQVKDSLARYDEQRRRAAELRRDPYQLEDALAALQEAAKAWDTLQVRQEIDEYTLALQKRRDRVSVAEFEVRGDVGIPEAGRALADEVLPALKGRFELVERGQLAKVAGELKLEASDLFEDESCRRQVGQLARVRYLVLGSVTRVSSVVANARLVDVRTGLVVQTAKVVARSPEDLLAQMPQLGHLLLMTDEEQLAFEQQQQVQPTPADLGPVAVQPLPPPPEAPLAPPPPVVVHNPRPPVVGAIRVEDFDRLPPVPLAPPSVAAVHPPAPVRDKFLQVAVQLGDNLFLRGDYQAAYRHFDLALSLSPGHQDLRLRLDSCRPHLPPPPPVVVVQPPPPPRPRLAVLNFVVAADAGPVSAPLGAWTAEHLAPYLCPPYQVVDRGEVFWWMGRLGMSLADLLNDPTARRWLGRALDVRFFLLGTIRPGPGGMVVTTHLVDAECGCQQGCGRIQVCGVPELKLRLGELARLTLLSPADRARYEQELIAWQAILQEAHQHCEGKRFALAIQVCNRGLQLRPDNVEIRVLLQQADAGQRQWELEEARRREWERQQALAAEFQRRQLELAQAAEAARIRAEQEAARLAESQRLALQHLRQQANQQLAIQARLALQNGDFALSIQFFESSVALNPCDDGYRELAQAQAQATAAEQAQRAAQVARRQEELRRQQEAQLIQARAQVEQERQRRLAEEKARRDAQAARDQAEYTRLVDQAERLLVREQYEQAVVSLQQARTLKKTDEVERLLSQALVQQARASAQQEGAAARVELERQLAAEKAQREEAETEARRNRELYTQALKRAKQALDDEHFDEATAEYENAGKLFKTDVVLTGLRQAEQGRSRQRAQAEAEKRKQEAEDRRAADLAQAMKDGQAALDAQRFAQAAAAFQKAKELAPTDVDVLAGLSKAEQLRSEQAARLRRQKEDQQRLATFRTLLDSARANRAAKRNDAAAATLREALKVQPGDAEAQALLQEIEAEQAAVADARARAAAEKKAADYEKSMRDGRFALSAQRYEAALQAFQAAQQIMPGDTASQALIRQAEQAKADAARQLAEEAKKKQLEQQRLADANKALQRGRAALAQGDLATAAQALATAAQLTPDDAEVRKAQGDLHRLEAQAQAEEAARQKQQEQFQALLQQAQVALQAQQFEEAIRASQDAQRLRPGNAQVRDLLQQAQKARADAEQRDQQADKVKQLVAKARAAMPKDLDDAAQALSEAAKLAPKDPVVIKAQDELRQARLAVDKKKKQADYDAAIKAGREALAGQRYDAAIQSFTEATQLLPGDQRATALLRQARQAKADAEAARAMAEQRQANLLRLMAAGQAAMQALQFEEAIKAYTEATKLAPQDPAAVQALREATKAAEANKPKPQVGPNKPPAEKPGPANPAGGPRSPAIPEYLKHMQAGTAFEGQLNFAEAVKSYRAALRVAPNDQRATLAIQAAELKLHLLEGRKALLAKRFAEAERAYEEALKLAPGNAEAMMGLQQARQGKR